MARSTAWNTGQAASVGNFNTGGPITSSPIVYNDILYVGSADHILYALMALKVWPEAQRPNSYPTIFQEAFCVQFFPGSVSSQ